MKQPLNKYVVILVVVLGINVLKAQPNYPDITFVYNWQSKIMDWVGSFYFGVPIDNEYLESFDVQLPSFVATWQKDVSVLFKEVFDVFGCGFKTPKRTAVINLSHNNSYGSPWFLILGLVDYFKGPWQLSINREDAFSALLFHELLHVWLDENFDQQQFSFCQKYRAEHQLVLDHIHLMALQKMVYTKLGRIEILDMLDTSYRQLQGQHYRRAWEIVNDIEEYEVVLQDIDQCVKKVMSGKT